jgi:hypothetical protein
MGKLRCDDQLLAYLSGLRKSFSEKVYFLIFPYRPEDEPDRDIRWY